MLRRTFIAATAAAGVAGCGREAAARQPAFDAEAFPFPLVTVGGAQAMATWRRLKAEGKGSPVILGDDQSLARLIEGADTGNKPAEILRMAAGLSMPGDLLKERARQRAASDAYYRGQAGLPKPSVVVVGEDGRSRTLTDAEVEATRAEDAQEPELGKWPDDRDAIAFTSPTSAVPLAAYGLKGQPLTRVHIALIPTADPTEIPAYLRFGNWNDCPAPEYHVALLRDQRDRYGAELVAIGGDTLEFEAARVPATREEAIALARDFHVYCEDSIHQGFETVSAFAQALMATRWRFFWWD